MRKELLQKKIKIKRAKEESAAEKEKQKKEAAIIAVKKKLKYESAAEEIENSKLYAKQKEYAAYSTKYLFCDSPRQVGKTLTNCETIIAEAKYYTHKRGEFATFACVSTTKQNAVQLFWPDFLQIIERDELYKKDGTGIVTQINLATKQILFWNNNRVEFFGLKDLGEMNKMRGRRVRLCIVDETSLVRDHLIREFHEAVLPYCLRTHDGFAKYSGTPGLIKKGFWWEGCSEQLDNSKNVRWNLQDHLQLIEDLKEKGKTIQDWIDSKFSKANQETARFKRENLGLWIEDLSSLAFKFNIHQNIFDGPSEEVEYILKEAIFDTETKQKIDIRIKSKRYLLDPAKEWKYVLGCDFGFGHDCAYVVLAFEKHSRQVRIVECINFAGAIAQVSSEMIKQLNDYYKFFKIVGDTGGLGKGYAEDLRHRYNNTINLEAAKKQERKSHLVLMNSAFVEANILVGKDLLIVEDYQKLVKNDFEDVKDGQDDHLADAALYGWWLCQGFLSTPPPPPPKTPEQEAAALEDNYMKHLEELEEEELYNKNKGGGYFDPYK